MTTSGYLYVIKKNGSLGSEYILSKDRVYNLGSDFRCHLRFPLKGFFGTACSISTNKTGAAILKKLGSYRVLLNSGVIASPKKLKFGDVLQVGQKVFRWDRLKYNSVQKSSYSSKTPGLSTSKSSARKEVRRKSVGDFRSRIKSSTLSTWKETNENVAASSSEFSKTKRSSKSRSNQKLVASKSETKPRANTSKIPRIQSATKRQLKLNMNIPKHADSNQLTPTLNTKDLPPQLKPESIKKAQSLKKSMEIASLSKRKHLDDSFIKMAKKIKLSKDLMDESAGDHLLESETSNFDDSLPIAPDSPLTISPRRSAGVDASGVDASPTINSRKSLFNDHNVSGIKTLMETPPHNVNIAKKSPKQEFNELLNTFESSSLNKKASGSKSTGKKRKQPAKSSRFSLSTRKAPRSRLISDKTKTPSQLLIALKSVSVMKKSARKTPKAKTTPLRSASKRLSKMYKSPKSPAMKTPKKEVSFSISPKRKGSPVAWTATKLSIKTSPRSSSANNSFNLNPLLNGSPMKIPKNSPKASTSLARISTPIKTSEKSSSRRFSQNNSFNVSSSLKYSPIKTSAKSSLRKSSQNNSFNVSSSLKASPVKTPKNSPKASTSSGRVSTSTNTRKINVSVKKTHKNDYPIKTSPRKSLQNSVLNLVSLFEGDSETKTLKISPNVSTRSARISTSRTSKINLSAKKTRAKSSISTPRKIIKLEELTANQTLKNTSPMKTPTKSSPIKTPAKSSPMKTPAKSSPIKTPAKSSPIKTPVKSSPIKTPAKSSPIKTPAKSSPIKTQAKSSPIKTPAKSSPIKTPAKSSPMKTPARNSLSSKEIIEVKAPKSKQTPKNVSPAKTELSTRRSSQNIAFNFSGLFDDSPTKTPNFKTSRSVRISASPRNSFSPKKTPQISSRIKTSPRSQKNSPKVSTSSARTSTSAKKSPTKISPRSQNCTLNLDALFDISSIESPVKTPAPTLAQKTPKLSVSAKRTLVSNKGLVEISSLKTPKNNPNARNFTSPHKTPQINISDHLIQFSPLKTPKVGVASTSTGRASRSAVLYVTPSNKTSQQISPVLTSTGKIAKLTKKNTPLQLSATKTKTLKNELLNSSLQLFKTPTQRATPARTRSARKAPKSPSTTALRLSMEAPIENVSFSFVTALNSPAAIQRTTRNTESAKKSLNTSASSRISKTPTLQIKNSPNISAKIEKSPKNVLTDVKRVKSLMKTPGRQLRSPKNDLTDVKGVRSLMKTPGMRQRSPKNDLTDVKGVKSLMKTPGRQQRLPKNDLRDVKGVKSLMKTSGRQLRSPKNDLTDVKGVKSLMKTPGRRQRSPKNDLTDVKGVKSLMKTPGRQQRSPKNDLTDIEGVEYLMKTPEKKHRKSPQNDLSDLRGVKQLMNPLRSPKSPLNDLTNITSVKNLFRTSTGNVKSPTNDLTNVQGVKRLMNPFHSPKAHVNDLTDIEGVKELFNSPTTAQLTTRQSGGKSQVNKSLTTARSTGKNITTTDMNNLLFDSVKGAVDDNMGNFELKKSIITYERKNKTLSPVKQPPPKTSNRKSLQYNVAVNYASIQQWVDECTPAVSQMLPMKPKIEETTVLTPTTRRKARLLRGEDCTLTPEKAKPARKIVSRRKVTIASDITVQISETVEPSPQRTRKRLANVETEMTNSANLKRSKRVQFEEPASPTSESSARPKRGRSALKEKVEGEPEMKPVRGRRKAAKKEEEPPQEEIIEVAEVKALRGRRKAVKNVEEKEEPIQQDKTEVEIKNVRDKRKAVKKVQENEEPAQQETVEVNAVRGRRKAAKKVEETEESIQEEKPVRGRRNASKKQVEKEDEPSPQEESKPVRKPRRGRSAKNENSDKENIAVKSPGKSNSPAIKKSENKQEPTEEKIVKTTRATRTTKKVTEVKESVEVEKKKPTRGNTTVAASQEEKEVTTTRTTRKKTVEETSLKPAPRTTRRKK